MKTDADMVDFGGRLTELLKSESPNSHDAAEALLCWLAAFCFHDARGKDDELTHAVSLANCISVEFARLVSETLEIEYGDRLTDTGAGSIH